MPTPTAPTPMGSRGSVDTTKTRSDPIGAAKGKQTNTMTSCQTSPWAPSQTSPPPQGKVRRQTRDSIAGGGGGGTDISNCQRTQ